MSHRKCGIPYCGVVIMPTSLLCGRHWSQVSAATQRAVWATYRACSLRPLSAPDKERSAYFAAVDKAIAEVTGRDRAGTG